MPNGWEPQPYRPPYRVLVVCNPTERYFDATDAERQEICLPRFKQMIGEWAELGARPVSSFVDDVFQVGVPPTPFFSFYLIYEVDELEIAAALMQAARQTVGGVRLDTWVKLAVRVGRPFFSHEETVPHRTVDPEGNS